MADYNRRLVVMPPSPRRRSVDHKEPGNAHGSQSQLRALRLQWAQRRRSSDQLVGAERAWRVDSTRQAKGSPVYAMTWTETKMSTAASPSAQAGMVGCPRLVRYLLTSVKAIAPVRAKGREVSSVSNLGTSGDGTSAAWAPRFRTFFASRGRIGALDGFHYRFPDGSFCDPPADRTKERTKECRRRPDVMARFTFAAIHHRVAERTARRGSHRVAAAWQHHVCHQRIWCANHSKRKDERQRHRHVLEQVFQEILPMGLRPHQSKLSPTKWPGRCLIPQPVGEGSRLFGRSWQSLMMANHRTQPAVTQRTPRPSSQAATRRIKAY